LGLKGLSSPVRVLRDRWGVAHIYAQNQHDLFLPVMEKAAIRFQQSRGCR
jgi:hypothetical protein